MILSKLAIIPTGAGFNPAYDSHPIWTAGSIALVGSPMAAPRVVNQPQSENPRTASGNSFAMFGGDYYDRIHITPQSIDVGNMLDTVQQPVNVWNAYRRALPLDAISISGGQGVFLSGGVSAPGQFAALQSSNYTLTITLDGPPSILNVITWDFVEVTAQLAITGKRLVLFPVSPDWNDGISEEYGYLTDVMRAYDDTEQRVQLKDVPNRSLGFTAMVLEARDAAELDALLFGWQHRLFGVPWWQDAQQLATDVIVGSNSIPISTTNRAFEVGGIVLLWIDQHTWEVQQVDSMDASTIATVNGMLKTWPANKTLVMPVKLGRMTNSETLEALAPAVAQMKLKFSIEATA